MEKKCEVLENKMELSKKIEDKFKTFEQKLELLRKTLEEKDKQILSLEEKISNSNISFESKLDKLEKKVKNNENRFKCDKCNFATNSEPGLKGHMSKKHKDQSEIVETNFPQQCSLCEKYLDSCKELKKHMRTHSYKYCQFKCELCEFIGGDDLEMEVHAARMHGIKFECGLCDYEAEDLEKLDIHLKTCEYYRCEICKEKIWQFTNIKTHFKKKHDLSKRYDYPGVTHVKPSRENKDVYDQKYHTYISLFPENQDKKSEL